MILQTLHCMAPSYYSKVHMGFTFELFTPSQTWGIVWTLEMGPRIGPNFRKNTGFWVLDTLRLSFTTVKCIMG